jgi:hypothetical protein
MLESHVIQTRGFRNVDGGFQVTVRCPYYRGIWASLLEGATVTVDGEVFAADDVRWTLGATTYTRVQLAEAVDDRWPFEEPAVLTVARPGGLEPGLHEVEVAITWRWSYIPVEMQPTTSISSRKVVLAA